MLLELGFTIAVIFREIGILTILFIRPKVQQIIMKTIGTEGEFRMPI